MEGTISRVVILGDGGHASALADWVGDCPRITDDAQVRSDDRVLIGVGDVATRKRLFEKFEGQVFGIGGIDANATIMRGAIVYGSVTLGKNVLINTGAQIDHDCVIGDHCVIGPSAILCGSVKLGEGCYVGPGAIIGKGIKVPDETVIRLGAKIARQADLDDPVNVVLDGAATARYLASDRPVNTY